MHDGHRGRLRKRFQEEGLDGFQPHNILEMLLFYSVPRRDTNELGHRLIQTFGSISGVFDASFEDLLRVPGIGETSACLIKMIPSLCRLYLADKYSDHQIFDSTEKAGDFLLKRYVGRTEETVSVLCMDTKCKCLNWEIISEGSANAAEVNVRKIIEAIIRCNATCCIICHNHPGGVALPSDQDVRMTKYLIDALKPLGVHLLDHIIIGGNDYVSMAQSRAYNYLFAFSRETTLP